MSKKNKVYITSVGGITSKRMFDSETLLDQSFTDNFHVSTIDPNILKSLKCDGKGMMSQQTKLLMKSLELCFNSNPYISTQIRQDASIYIGSGPISLETRTIKSLIKFLVHDDNQELDYSNLAENIENLPPLDGIKMLSTAGSHFYAKELEIHGPGQPIYCGTSSGLLSLALAYESIRDGYSPMAIIGSADAPIVSHTLPYLKAESGLNEDEYFESSITYILQSEDCLENPNQALCEIENIALSTFLMPISDEDFESHISTLLKCKKNEIANSLTQKSQDFLKAKNNRFQTSTGASAALFDLSYAIGQIKHRHTDNLIVSDLSSFGHTSSVLIGAC